MLPKSEEGPDPESATIYNKEFAQASEPAERTFVSLYAAT